MAEFYFLTDLINYLENRNRWNKDLVEKMRKRKNNEREKDGEELSIDQYL